MRKQTKKAITEILKYAEKKRLKDKKYSEILRNSMENKSDLAVTDYEFVT